MNKIKTVIADNEPLALQRVEQFLSKEKDVELLAASRDGEKALKEIREHNPELVFLDIEMPGLDGIEIVEMLGGGDLPFVVFVTAFDEYAVKAFEVNALDYLLKPYNRKRFKETLERARKHILQFRKEGEETSHSGGVEDYLSRLLIKTSQKMFFIKVEEIDWIESDGNYAKIVTSNNTYLIRATLKYLEERLDPSHFVRIHKSTIVNVNMVKELEQWFTGDYEILLKNGETLKMSRNYRAILERFK